MRSGRAEPPDAPAPAVVRSGGSSVQRPVLSIRLRQAPLRACASFRKRTAMPGQIRSPCRSGSGSRVVTTRTLAMSSVQ